MRIVFVSPVSASIELENDATFYAPKTFDVYLNDKKVLSNYQKNVFSLFNLKPATKYEVRVDDEKLYFETERVSKVIDIYPIDGDCTKHIQKAFDEAPVSSLVVIHEGTYPVTNLFLRSNVTVDLQKGALLSGSVNPDDYLELQGEEVINGEVPL